MRNSRKMSGVDSVFSFIPCTGFAEREMQRLTACLQESAEYTDAWLRFNTFQGDGKERNWNSELCRYQLTGNRIEVPIEQTVDGQD